MRLLVSLLLNIPIYKANTKEIHQKLSIMQETQNCTKSLKMI